MSITVDQATTAHVGIAFFDAFNEHDLDAALSMLTAGASVDLEPAGWVSARPAELRAFLSEVLAAFPDAEFRIRRTARLGDGSVFVEGVLAGNQRARFLGAPHQGAYLSIAQAWVLGTDAGAITSIAGYWSQDTVFRRLGVRHVDELSGWPEGGRIP